MNLFLAYFDWMNFVSDLVVSIISGVIMLIIAFLAPNKITIKIEERKALNNKEIAIEKLFSRDENTFYQIKNDINYYKSIKKLILNWKKSVFKK